MILTENGSKYPAFMGLVFFSVPVYFLEDF